MTGTRLHDREQLLAALVELNSLTLKIFEAIETDRRTEVMRLLRERQEHIEGLGRFDAPSTPGRDHEIIQEFKKLIESGARLSRRVAEIQGLIEARRRQNAVARTAARGYRPAPKGALSTRRVES